MPSNPPLAWNAVYYVYMMANEGRTTLYIGMTSNLKQRLGDHRFRRHPNSFTAKYRLNRLVWFERFADVRDAISREKQLKRWRREKKEFLINQINPKWEDLAVSHFGLSPPPKDSEFR